MIPNILFFRSLLNTQLRFIVKLNFVYNLPLNCLIFYTFIFMQSLMIAIFGRNVWRVVN